MTALGNLVLKTGFLLFILFIVLVHFVCFTYNKKLFFIMSEIAGPSKATNSKVNESITTTNSTASNTILATRPENVNQFLLGQVSQFDISKPSYWADYLIEVNNFFTCNDLGNVSNDKQRSIFCQLIGSNCFKLLRSLIAPREYNELSLDELKNTLTQHFAPRVSSVFYSYKFWTRSQGQNESSNDYVAALRLLANKCNYGNMLDRLLRDRFISGVCNTHRFTTITTSRTRN